MITLVCLFLLALAVVFLSAAMPNAGRWAVIICGVSVAALVVLTWAKILP